MPKISIIVPIYNAESYMKKCIDSIIRQTLDDIEIILVNDGSVDNSGIIADEYAKKDSRIKVIHQNNQGPSKARNNGISLATGKYLGFVDSDDYIEENMYEILYNLANEKNIKVAMCNYREEHIFNKTSQIVQHKLTVNKIYNNYDITKDIISTFTGINNYGFYNFWNKIYLRTWINDIGIAIDESREHGEDWWFNISIFNKLDSFICTDKALYNYIHINENSLMAKYRENQFDLFLDGRKKLISVVPDEFINYEELNTRFVYEFSSYIIRTFKEVKDVKKRKELIMRVLRNEYVIESSKGKNNLSKSFKIIVFLIKSKMSNLAYISYKFRSLF